MHPGIQGLRTIHLKAVVFGPATIDAERNTAGDSHPGFILPGLVTDTCDQRSQLRKITPIQTD